MICGQHIEEHIPDARDAIADTIEMPLQVPGWFVDATGRLGQEFVDMRSRLVEVGTQLADRLEPPAAALVRESAERIKSLGFRVAVIGQAKAGKSSFLNALAGYPDLLPAGVDPCTTSVIRLHFNHPTVTAPGAIFRFFSADEWQQLAEDGGPLSVMAHRLGRAFDLDVYRSKLTELRARAPQRPQSDLCELLGRHHAYDWISPGLIARYAGAAQRGRPGSSTRQPSLDSYCDITRSANVYLDNGSFACPLTLIDTPGLDDFSLARDEIVLRSIEDADACVIVLSAHQGLSKADAELLRMMQGLRKDRIVVFINRLDELDDATRRGPCIVDQVRAVLQGELDASIPVLLGSAKWANEALRAGGLAEDSLEAARAASRAKAIGVATANGIEDLLRCSPQQRVEKLGPLLHAASGLPLMYRKLEELFRDSTPAGRLHEFAATFAAIAQQAESSSRNELLALEENVKAAHRSVLNDSWELHRLKGEVDRLDVAIAKLDRVSGKRRTDLERRQHDALERLRRELHNTVRDYVTRERNAIVFALDQKPHKAGVRFDVSGMRLLLEQTFLAGYRRLHQSIVEAEESAPRHLQRVIDEALPRTQIAISAVVLSGSFVYPRLSALSRVGPFDIDPGLWSKWRRRHPTIREAVAEFERILTTEFLGVAAELAAVAEREVGARAEAFVGRLTLAQKSASHAVLKHRDELQSRLDYMRHALQPQVMEQFLAEQLGRLSECRERVLVLARLARWLDAYPGEMAAPAPEQQAQDFG
jgi:hypothetical protein